MNKCNKTIIDQFYTNNTLVVLDLYLNATMSNYAFDIYSYTYSASNNTYNNSNGSQNIVIGSNVDLSLPFSPV